MSENSKQLVSQLLRDEFDKNQNFWQEGNAKEVIQTAKELGLKDLVQEMEQDLKLS